MLVIEEEKCHKFEDGLNDYIRAYVTGFGHDDFSKIMTCALNVERVKKEEYDRKERRQGKNNLGQSSSYQHQNKKFRGPQGSSQPTLQGPAQPTGSKTILPAPSVASALGGSLRGPTPPYCTHCGRRPKGDCWRLTSACLVCGSNELIGVYMIVFLWICNKQCKLPNHASIRSSSNIVYSRYRY